MKRRTFIKNTATALTVPTLVNGMAVSAFGASTIADLNNADNDKILILITLSGGNDGLHTIVPLDQYDNLANARPDIILPENQLLPVTNTLAFNPGLTGFKSLYDNAQMTVVQNVSYPNPDLSHFRATKIWETARPSDETETTGWLGRHFDVNHPNFPVDYPNPDFPAPFALKMGRGASVSCQGAIYNYGMVINNIDNFTPIGDGGQTSTDDTPYDKTLYFMQTLIQQTGQYTDAIGEAANIGSNIENYPDTEFAQKLKNVATLISGGLKTKVYIVEMHGFDTHDSQGGLQGPHSSLTRVVSDGIAAFQADISALGFGEKVIGLTTSEFGRRIFQNAALGTDHGVAAPMFFFGECLNPGIIGSNPVIPESIEVSDVVPMEFDFRDALGSVLMDWFEVPEDTVKDIFHEDFQYIPIVNPCDIGVDTSEVIIQNSALIEAASVYPNPAKAYFNLKFECKKATNLVFEIQNNLGQTLQTKQYSSTIGANDYRFNLNDVAAGNYRVIIKDKAAYFQKVLSLTVL